LPIVPLHDMVVFGLYCSVCFLIICFLFIFYIIMNVSLLDGAVVRFVTVKCPLPPVSV